MLHHGDQMAKIKSAITEHHVSTYARQHRLQVVILNAERDACVGAHRDWLLNRLGNRVISGVSKPNFRRVECIRVVEDSSRVLMAS